MGRTPITYEQEIQIFELLQEGRLSERAISERVGVSRGTVNHIKLGTRPVHLGFRVGTPLLSFRGVNEKRVCKSCGFETNKDPCVVCVARRARGLVASDAEGVDDCKPTRSLINGEREAYYEVLAARAIKIFVEMTSDKEERSDVPRLSKLALQPPIPDPFRR